MVKEITLREFRDGDRRALENIIGETWHYDKFCSAKTAEKLSRAYLNSCLIEQTYTQVAVADGTVAGIIMGKNIRKHHCPFRLKMDFAAAGLSLLASKEGRQVCKFFKNISEIDKELLLDCKKEYPGEVSFFAVSPKYRGEGIGKMLFDSLLAYMETERLDNFYLFTDTSCNYGFYERQGMTRKSQKHCTLEMEEYKEEMDFFVYEYRHRAQ